MGSSGHVPGIYVGMAGRKWYQGAVEPRLHDRGRGNIAAAPVHRGHRGHAHGRQGPSVDVPADRVLVRTARWSSGWLVDPADSES